MKASTEDPPSPVLLGLPSAFGLCPGLVVADGGLIFGEIDLPRKVPDGPQLFDVFLLQNITKPPPLNR